MPLHRYDEALSTFVGDNDNEACRPTIFGIQTFACNEIGVVVLSRSSSPSDAELAAKVVVAGTSVWLAPSSSLSLVT